MTIILHKNGSFES